MAGPVGGVPQQTNPLEGGDKPAKTALSEEGDLNGRKVRRNEGERYSPHGTGKQPQKSLHERTGSHKPLDVNYFANPQPDSLLSNSDDDTGDSPGNEPDTPTPAGTNDDLMKQLEEVEARKKQSGSSHPEDEGFADDDGNGMESHVQPELKPTEPLKAKLEVTGNPSEGAGKVKATPSAENPEETRKQKKLEKHLEGKLGFLDKHKKSIIATVVGGLLVSAGALAAIGFAPAGICIYAVGIMLLTQGVAHMLNEDADGAPPIDDRKEDNKPKNEDEEKKKEKKDDQGQYMLVDNPSYKGPDRQSQVDYSGDVTTAEAVDPSQVGKSLSKLAANPNPESTEAQAQAQDVLTEVNGLFGASSEQKPSRVMAKILAKLVRKAGIDPDNPDQMKLLSDALDEFRAVVESGASSEEQARAAIDIVAKIISTTQPGADSSELLLKMLRDFEHEMPEGDPALVNHARKVSKQLVALVEASKQRADEPSGSAASVVPTGDGHSKAATGADSPQSGPVGQGSASAASADAPVTFDDLKTPVGTGKYLAFGLEFDKAMGSMERREREEVKEVLMGCAAAVLRSEEKLRDQNNAVQPPPFFSALITEVSGLNKKTSDGTEYEELVKKVWQIAHANKFLNSEK
ncbi:MAG: hypothetical protein ACR2PT_12560 [Endozoicomonas sp.]